jgi:hypothetical protein
MPALSLAPVLSFFAAFQRVSPVVPLQTFLRTTSNRLRPSPPRPFTPTIRHAQSTVLGSGRAGLHQLATVLHEPHPGSLPTIVLGGFVPDATEQVFLLRGHLAKSGSLYYFNYSPEGFSLDLLCAQLDDLIAELLHLGQPPVSPLRQLRRRDPARVAAPAAGRRVSCSGRRPRLRQPGGLRRRSARARGRQARLPARPGPATLPEIHGRPRGASKNPARSSHGCSRPAHRTRLRSPSCSPGTNSLTSARACWAQSSESAPPAPANACRLSCKCPPYPRRLPE